MYTFSTAKLACTVTPYAESKVRESAEKTDIGKGYISCVFSALHYMNFSKTPRKKHISHVLYITSFT